MKFAIQGLVRRRFALGLVLGGLVLASAIPALADEAPFLIDLPPGFTVKAREPGPDFYVFDVLKGKESYVGVYIGGHPGFPMGAGEVRSVGETGGKVAESKRPDGSLRREYLIVAPAGYILHVWTQEPAGDLATADRIAASIRAKPPKAN
jgi:hypothetical protein